MMSEYLISSIFLICFAAVACFNNIQIRVIEGSANATAGNFTKIGEQFYLIEANQKKTWLGAVHFCRSKGAHLTSIERKDEWKALSSHLVSSGYRTDQWFWIGGNDIDKPFEFFWIGSGKPIIFTKWSATQPDNLGGNERCVHLWRKGDEFQMNDWECHQQAHYICKADNNTNTVSVTYW